MIIPEKHVNYRFNEKGKSGGKSMGSYTKPSKLNLMKNTYLQKQMNPPKTKIKQLLTLSQPREREPKTGGI